MGFCRTIMLLVLLIPFAAATQSESFWSRLTGGKSLSTPNIPEEINGTLDKVSEGFATVKDALSNVALVTKENIDKWLTEANILDGIRVTIADTAAYYAKVAKDKANMTMDELSQFLETLSKEKDIKIEELKEKLSSYMKTEDTGVWSAAVQDESLWSRLTGRSPVPDTAEGYTEKFDEIFQSFGKIGDKLSDVATIAKENIDTWLQEAEISDGKKVTIADTANYYGKGAKDKVSVTIDEFYQFLETLSKELDTKIEELKEKLGYYKNCKDTSKSASVQGQSFWSRLTGGASVPETAGGYTDIFHEIFKSFAGVGDKLCDVAAITKENIDTWLTEAGILDGKSVTIADTAEYYTKVAKDKASVTMDEFYQLLETLSKEKDIKFEELKEKLSSYKKPGEPILKIPYMSATVPRGDFWSRLSRSLGLSKTPAAEAKTGTVEEIFKSFATIGDQFSDYAQITKENIDTWLKGTEVLSDKGLTVTDTANYYAKVAKDKASLSLDEFYQFIETLSKETDIKIEELKEALGSYKPPEITGFFRSIWQRITSGTVRLLNCVTRKASCYPSKTAKHTEENLWSRISCKLSDESTKTISDKAVSLWSRVTGSDAVDTCETKKEEPCSLWNRVLGSPACKN